MPADFLADPNEDQEAADFFMAKFREEGARQGRPLSLVVRVTKIPQHKLDAVESAVRKLYDCSRIERSESGFPIKRARLTAYLNPIAFERQNLLKAARALYRIILDHEVTVEIVGREGAATDALGFWRRLVATLGLTYCIAVWVLPVLIVLIFGELPYLDERDFFDRLAFSAGGSLALVIAWVVVFPDRLRVLRTGPSRLGVKQWFYAFAGLAMFTAFPALWIGNLFGAAVKLSPGTEYSARFTVVDTGRSSRRSTSLSLRSADGTKDFYLTLSSRRFNYGAIHVGDRLLLEGKQNAVGVYIDRIVHDGGAR